jgi:hypothetical protein
VIFPLIKIIILGSSPKELMIIEMLLMNPCFTLTPSLSLRARGLPGFRFNLSNFLSEDS